MILEWSINSGVISGKRYTKTDLSEVLQLSKERIETILEDQEAQVIKSFSTTPGAASRVFKMVNSLAHQLEFNRSQILQHLEYLNNELMIHDQLRSDMEPGSVVSRELGINQRSISYQKIETIRLLLDSNDKFVNFLNLFNKSGGTNDPKKPGFGLVIPEDDGSDPNKTLTRDEAIKLLENKDQSVLATQGSSDQGNQPKNPNSGFEDLEKLKPDFEIV